VSTKESSTASLEGKVVKDPGRRALKKAIIALIGENQPESDSYTATSDQEGHFKVIGIRAGRYHMFVERTGYLAVDEKHRHSLGLTLYFDARQDVKDQVLRMLPAAIVTGRVVDEEGDPMPDVQVWISRKRIGSKSSLILPDWRKRTILENIASVACSPASITLSLLSSRAFRAWFKHKRIRPTHPTPPPSFPTSLPFTRTPALVLPRRRSSCTQATTRPSTSRSPERALREFEA